MHHMVMMRTIIINHTTLIHNPLLAMSNSSSLLLSQRSWYEWAPLSFHTLLHHSHVWPIVTSVLTLCNFLASTIPFFLCYILLLLPKFLWSLQTRIDDDETSLSRYVNADEMVLGDCYINDDYWYDKRDLVADVGEEEDILFLSVPPDKEGEDSFLPEQPRTSCCEGNHVASPVEEDDNLIINIPIQDIPIISSAHISILDNYEDDDLNLRGLDVNDHSHAIDAPTKEERSLQDVIGHDAVDKSKGVEKEEKEVVMVEEEYHLTDTCTNGSTSKSSCEWRGSGNLRESETDGFFSSSSRRSSSQWETYTVHKKYDEEMAFFDRISSQKLKETESLRSIKVQPRSIPERIARKQSTKNKRSVCDPYHELEAAYVAQVCLAWEAISWNYHSFHRYATSDRRKEDRGCPARVAQRFQQFLVLLQRFVENEPYEYGRRPEVYARLRISSPMLLHVPEFHGDDAKDEQGSRITSPEFLKIMEDIIKTFMKFLEADKERHWQALKALLRRSKSSTVDPNMLNFIRRANKKKKAKLKEMQKGGNCMRKVQLKAEEDMEVFMCLVDVKIVSRVLRMPQVSELQLQWCEEKIRKLRVSNGRAQRDPTPLFFPGQ